MAIDLNAETYPYDVVQYLLDQTATFTVYAAPLPRYFENATLLSDPNDFFGINGGYGLALGCSLHVFESTPAVRDGSDPVSVGQTIGCRAGEFRAILRFVPPISESARWSPGSEPPPAIFDRWRSQPCVLTDAAFSFGNGEQLRAYGIGRTYPVYASGGPKLLLGAICNAVDGDGTFRDHEASFTLCGTLSPELGFEGVVVGRIVDPSGDFATDAEPDEIEAAQSTTGAAYLVLRGVKKDRTVKTTYGPKPTPDLDSLVTPSEMRRVRYSALCECRPPRSSMEVGPTIAHMTADVRFNISAPPGTAAAPTPFTTAETYEFVTEGGRAVGTIKAGVIDGVAFGLRFPSAPEQPGVRFAGVGPVTVGSGAFAGAQGLLTVNSVIGIAPHALSLTHVLHLIEPAALWRRAGTDA